ncbi:hypothetical protein LINPERPRIM_LOCUS2995 [Linum perenne]
MDCRTSKFIGSHGQGGPCLDRELLGRDESEGIRSSGC